MPELIYERRDKLSAAEFERVLRASTLGERRPVDDPACLEGMVRHANLTIVARDGDRIVGVSRSVTDFHYCCYLSDLAVDDEYQRRGIGKELVRLTQEALEPTCTLILLSAPGAVDYYPRIGMEHHPQAWILKPGQRLR